MLAVVTLLMMASGANSTAVKVDPHSLLGGLAIVCAAVLAATLRSKATVSALLFSLAGGLRMLSVEPAAVSQIAHAVLAQGLLASSFVALIETAPGWAAPSPLEDGGFPSLRNLAWLTPAVTLVQIALGAAHRRDAAGVVPHVSWAFATAICVMMAGTFVLTQKDSGKLLRRISAWLLGLTATQLLLGVGAYLAKVNAGESWLALFPTAHITTGSLVMALSVAWSIVVWRDTSASAHSLAVNTGRHS